MKSNLALIISLAWAISASAITIDTVPVGDIGNPNDPSDGDSLTAGVQNFGAVGYAYRIGKYEVTVGQYTEFLNAVAATDTFGLYNPNMATRTAIAGIAQNCASGSCTYSVIGSPSHPVTYVSWGDAARFANWIQNGQPTGTQNNATTEDGAYRLNGATSHEALYTVTRNANAEWFIPSENEWYKAAYYQPAAQGGDSDSYWLYPMKTNSLPYSVPPPGTAAPDNTRAGNFYYNDGVANGYNDGYAVTGLSNGCLNSDGNNCLTDVGAYTSSPSFYGTFDQGGNVYEWTEGLGSGFGRYERGGSWAEGKTQSSWHDNFGGAAERADIGFRLASLAAPEPSTMLLSILALAALPTRRRKSVPCNRVLTVQICTLACWMGFSPSSSTLSAATVYDLKTDWSDLANPNGPWSYREGNNALPHANDWQGLAGDFTGVQPAWARAETGNTNLPAWMKIVSPAGIAIDWQLGDIVTHSTDDFNGVGSGLSNVIWTSPLNGKIDVSGGVWMGRDIGRGNLWGISKNGTSLTGGAIFSGDPYSRNNPFLFSAGSGGPTVLNQIPVSVGDVLKLQITRTSAPGDYAVINLTFTATADLPGDFNHDGSVGALDYVVWRKGLGTLFSQGDYDIWRSHFGQVAGSGTETIVNAAVPEPSTVFLAIAAFATLLTVRRKSVSHNCV